MITGDTKSQIDRIRDAFWSGGISNPLEVIGAALTDPNRQYAPTKNKSL
jgi:hypothetical protein